jgi:hypothetical protein
MFRMGEREKLRVLASLPLFCMLSVCTYSSGSTLKLLTQLRYNKKRDVFFSARRKSKKNEFFQKHNKSKDILVYTSLL